jgi:glycosyltransferase involved in cell wall biosynthesis
MINDGSTDQSGRILGEYRSCGRCIRVISQENQGLTKSLIRGCAEARGKFITRQDADDVSMPGRLAALYSLITSTDKIVMASSWSRCIGPEGEILCEIRRPEDAEEATRQLLNERQGPPGHGSVMFRKDAYDKVGGYRKEFYYGQDSDLWLRLGEKGLIAYVPSFLYAYRFSPTEISCAEKDIQKQFGEIGQLCRTARQRGEPEAELLRQASRLTDQVLGQRVRKGPRRGHRHRIAEGNYFIGSGLLKRGDPRAAVYFRQAIKAYPLHWRAWARLLLWHCGGYQRNTTDGTDVTDGKGE